MSFKTADLCDEFSAELQICETSFKSYGGKKRFCGPIVTVQVLDDNVLVRQAIETVPAGSVLVVDGGGSRKCALLGDMLAKLAESRGLEGAIINGCARDVADMAELNLGVLALGSMPLKSKKEGKGRRDVILQFGGVVWTPGHYVYADEDGVVIAGRALL
ncbi:ribonuclease E activity regulator RraA [Effusibacillus lacus]|uniref:4-hydroxy-4-methyl-2-oxoglutarate aldolase n=1 Tax=Effusibacillus lacus TaxID=1348429 RepID=A0A292YL19_9BACL|nr:ribonuclease E activity regulator RraA [Effusibacillus lacus]TCS69418.1 regulator of ribonuclease activity A [Effusibacillus lacus]GAX89185.1 ribonuclease [Effusibacillus lacus]